MSDAQNSPSRARPLASILMRVVAVTITLYPAVRKFTEYSHRVGEFRSYGLPWPELAVPLTGIIELVAIVVAIVAAGPNSFSVLVLLASAGLCLLGTGPYSYWDPTPGDLIGGQHTDLVPGSASGDGE